MIRTNIRIYSDQKNDTNEYTNIFVSKKGYEYDTNEYSWQKIFEYIRISEYSSHYVMPLSMFNSFTYACIYTSGCHSNNFSTSLKIIFIFALRFFPISNPHSSSDKLHISTFCAGGALAILILILVRSLGVSAATRSHRAGEQVSAEPMGCG